MLTRFVRIQLAVFTVASLVGLTAMVFGYMQVPTLLGAGRITVTMQLSDSGGLYRFANVTYRGVQIGKVTGVSYTPDGAVAELSLDSSPKVPANLVAHVRSVSAIGEQYVDLEPLTASPPYLVDGDVIERDKTVIPSPVGALLDRTGELLSSVPEGRLEALVDDAAKGFGGAGFDIGSLLDSGSALSDRFAQRSESAGALVDDSVPLLEGQAQSADDLRNWSRGLAAFTGQLVENDDDVRQILSTGPGAFGEVSALLERVQPTLPVLLSNLNGLGQVAVTYRPSLEQLLVLLPPFLSAFGNTGPSSNATGYPKGNFRLQISDPGACTVGFLPPSEWRSPADTTTVDTPDGLYCKLPQDSPIAARGARNLPCMGRPGKRAPTVDLCESDQEFQPLAMRQHVLGPNPVDPNLISQGIAPDSRVPGEQGLYAPTEGTPLPPDLPPPPPPVPNEGAPAAQPSGYVADGTGPSVAIATYDPRTGSYVGPDGVQYEQTDLVARPSNWEQLMLPGGGA